MWQFMVPCFGDLESLSVGQKGGLHSTPPAMTHQQMAPIPSALSHDDNHIREWQTLLESLTCRDASNARLNDMLVEESQQALSICDM